MKQNSVLLFAGFICLIVVAIWTGTAEFRNSKPLIASFADEQTARTSGPAPTVAILFQPGDCSGLIEALRVWNTPYEQQALNVSGRIYNVGDRRDLVEKVVKGSGMRFPVLPLDERLVRRLRAVLGYRTGSLVLIFDPEGQLRMAVPLIELSTRDARHNVLSFAHALNTPAGS